LGTAFVPSGVESKKPRVLLIDEIDKSDIDLPNDLLNLFEDGEFLIPELQRIKNSEITVRTADRKGEIQGTAEVKNGVVRCEIFPLVIMTSNDERDFPPPFLRRCLRLDMPTPTKEELADIVLSHLGKDLTAPLSQQAIALIKEFDDLGKKGTLATDQLLNAVYMMTRDSAPQGKDWDSVKKSLLKYLSSGGL
jgi:MoxR-like ATPase